MPLSCVQKNIFKDLLIGFAVHAQSILKKEWESFNIKVDPENLIVTVYTPDGKEDFFITATSAERTYEVGYQNMKEPEELQCQMNKEDEQTWKTLEVGENGNVRRRNLNQILLGICQRMKKCFVK